MNFYQCIKLPLHLTIPILLLLFQSNICLPQQNTGKKLDSLFTLYTDSGFTGSALVAEKNEITFMKGYGYANSENKIPNTPSTLFNVASIGKQFTAYAILLLESRGLLSTNDYISKYIGAFNDERDSTTIHHLLLHSSGLFIANTDLDYSTREKFIQSVKSHDMESYPGLKYRYSNAGYSLLAAIVEIVSTQPFETFISENIFVPCNMKNTGHPWEERMNKEYFATGYDKNKLPVQPEEDVWAARGPGNVMSNVEDLYLWVKALQNQKFMPEEIKNKIFFDYLPGKETYSWNKTRTELNNRFYHKGGGRQDFESQLMWFPDDEVIIIFLINNDLGLRGKLFKKILE